MVHAKDLGRSVRALIALGVHDGASRIHRSGCDGKPDGAALAGCWPYGHRLQPHALQGAVVAGDSACCGARRQPLSPGRSMCSSAWWPTPLHLQAVTGGADGVLAGLGPGSIFVDMSTVSPTVSRTLAAQVAAAGAYMLDAPVSGSVITLEEGQVVHHGRRGAGCLRTGVADLAGHRP